MPLLPRQATFIQICPLYGVRHIKYSRKSNRKHLGRKCFTPDYPENCLYRSLARLNKTKVAIFLLHDPPACAVQNKDVWHTMRSLRNKGLVDKIGLSSSKPQVIQLAMASGQVEVLQTPANLLVASSFRDIWLNYYHQGVHVVGNHLFPPQLLRDYSLSHSILARASAKLLPPGATLLCGTHNPSHLQEFSQWINDPCSSEQLALYFKQANLS
jgi:hypothetical protein